MSIVYISFFITYSNEPSLPLDFPTTLHGETSLKESIIQEVRNNATIIPSKKGFVNPTIILCGEFLLTNNANSKLCG